MWASFDVLEPGSLLSDPWTWGRALMPVVSSVNCPPLHSTFIKGIWLQTGRCKRSYRLTWLKARSVPVASGMAASRSSNDMISISVISCSQCQFQSPLLASCLGLGLSSQTFLGFYLCLCFLYFLLCRWLLSSLEHKWSVRTLSACPGQSTVPSRRVFLSIVLIKTWDDLWGRRLK